MSTPSEECVGVAVAGDPDSQRWWDELSHGRVVLLCCELCHRFHFPPMPSCPHCGSVSLSERASAGTGRVYSWIVVRRSLDPRFEADVPYTVLAVDLDEGVRMFGRLHGASAVAAGDQVTLVPVPTADGVVPGFRAV
jgi:uncharacterized OB-fold protein